MPFRGALVSRDMYMAVSIDQVTNDGYFPTQKEHLHLLEGVFKNIWSNTPPTIAITPRQWEGGMALQSPKENWMAGNGGPINGCVIHTMAM